MQFRLLTVEKVIVIHDVVLNPGELTGLAKDMSIDDAIARVDFQVHYNMISDEYELAAMYAVAISQAHAFRDGNKRTAHAVMEFILLAHEIIIAFDTKEVGNIIIKTAQGQLDEVELAAWLRRQKHR
jgi:death-on-curing protein